MLNELGLEDPDYVTNFELSEIRSMTRNNALYLLSAVYCTFCLASGNAVAAGNAAVFSPSGNLRFGGELLSNISSEAAAGIGILEKEAKLLGRMLSRDEIIHQLRKSEINFTQSSLSEIDFAIRVVQESSISESQLKDLFKIYRESLPAISGESTISSELDSAAIGLPHGSVPKFSVYRWSATGTDSRSRIEHVGGEHWSNCPEKCIIEESTTTEATRKRPDFIQTVYRLRGNWFDKTYPEWHPLVAARLSGTPSDKSDIASLFNPNLRTGPAFFNGYTFTQSSKLDGDDCIVFGNLDHAVYISTKDMRTIRGEFTGYSCPGSDGSEFQRVLKNAISFVRLNTDFKIVDKFPVPQVVRLIAIDVNEKSGTIKVASKLSSNIDLVSPGFDKFIPYLLVDEVNNTSVSVVKSDAAVSDIGKSREHAVP